MLNVSLGDKAGGTPLLSRPIFYTIIISTFATCKSSNGMFRGFLSNEAAASHTCLLELQLTWHKPGFMCSIRLVAAEEDRADSEHFHHHLRKFYWAALVWSECKVAPPGMVTCILSIPEIGL